MTFATKAIRMNSALPWLKSRAKHNFTAQVTSDRIGMYPHELIFEPAAKHRKHKFAAYVEPDGIGVHSTEFNI